MAESETEWNPSDLAKLYERLEAAKTALLVDTKSKFSELQSLFDAAETDLQSRLQHLARRDKNLETKRKELESSEFHLLSLKDLIAEHVDKLDLVEKRLEEKEREVEVKEVRVREMEEKEVKMRAAMEVKKREVESSKIDLHSLKSLIKKNVVQLEGLRGLTGEKNKDMECKMLENHAMEMKSNEIRVRQMEVRVRELEKREVKVQTSVDECEKQLEMKREELGLVEKSVAECSSSLESSELRLHSLKDLINEHVVELGLMEKRAVETKQSLTLVEKSLVEKERVLQVKEVRVREMEEREVKVRAEMEAKEREIESSKVKLDGLRKRIKEKNKECDKLETQALDAEDDAKAALEALSLVSHELRRKEMELELKEKQFDSRVKMEPLVDALAANETDLHSLRDVVKQSDQTVELSRQLGITDKTPGTNIIASIVKIEAAEPSVAISAAPTYTLPNEISISLQLSSDPAKLVLVMMQNSLTQYWTNGEASSKKGIALRHISILKFLRGISADVGPHLKEQARNLAAQWKPNLRADTENSLEILGFLLFIDIFGLIATLNEDEIVELIGSISEHKQSLEVCQTHDFSTYITGFILELIKKRKLIEAVKYIRTFKVNDKFPIIPLLDGCVQDAKKCSEEIGRIQMTLGEKEKVVDGRITDLKAAIQCIKDYKLESQYSSETIVMQIIELNSLKKKWRSLAPCPAIKLEQQEERKRKMPDASTSSPKQPKRNCLWW